MQGQLRFGALSRRLGDRGDESAARNLWPTQPLGSTVNSETEQGVPFGALSDLIVLALDWVAGAPLGPRRKLTGLVGHHESRPISSSSVPVFRERRPPRGPGRAR